LRKRAEWYCGPTVSQDAELWELEWRSQGVVVTYLKCSKYGEGGCHAEDDRGQGVVPYWKREKINWCGCRGGKEQSGAQARDSRGTAREKRAAQPREVKAQQSGAQSGEPESVARGRESSVPIERKSAAREGGSVRE